MGAAIGGGIGLLNAAAQVMRNQMIQQSLLDPRNVSPASVGVNNPEEFNLAGVRASACSGPGCITKPGIFGGIQGAPQQTLFGIRCCSWLMNQWAGTHDFLNNFYWYNAVGDAKVLSGFASGFGEFLSVLNVALATPFAVASMVQPYATALTPLFTTPAQQGADARNFIPYGQPMFAPFSQPICYQYLRSCP